MTTSLERQNSDESDLILPGRKESLEYLSARIPFMKSMSRTGRHGVTGVWQPSMYLPDHSKPDKAAERIAEIQQQMRQLSDEEILVLISNGLTEVGLPLYTAELARTNGVYTHEPLRRWVGEWAGEEDRHGMLLDGINRYSGRIDMLNFEWSRQQYFQDGTQPNAGKDPYKVFVYTSFQELATNKPHQTIAKIAQSNDAPLIAEVCGQIAADERYHANVYAEFVQIIFERDPNGMMEAVCEMLEQKIVMPAHNMREINEDGSTTKVFQLFSDTAQAIEAYTSKDYAHISGSLIAKWGIGEKVGNEWKPLPMKGLDERGKDAQTKILRIVKVTERFADRSKKPPLPKWDSRWLVRPDKLAS